MADSRIKSIMAAIETSVTGLLTTGTNVSRGRDERLVIGDAPGLLIYMGAEAIVAEHAQTLKQCELEIAIVAVAIETETQIDDTLAEIRKEITVAVLADDTLGLSYVSAIKETGADEPEINADGDRPIGKYRTNWTVHYRRSWGDPSA